MGGVVFLEHEGNVLADLADARNGNGSALFLIFDDRHFVCMVVPNGIRNDLRLSVVIKSFKPDLNSFIRFHALGRKVFGMNDFAVEINISRRAVAQNSEIDAVAALVFRNLFGVQDVHGTPPEDEIVVVFGIHDTVGVSAANERNRPALAARELHADARTLFYIVVNVRTCGERIVVMQARLRVDRIVYILRKNDASATLLNEIAFVRILDIPTRSLHNIERAVFEIDLRIDIAVEVNPAGNSSVTALFRRDRIISLRQIFEFEGAVRRKRQRMLAVHIGISGGKSAERIAARFFQVDLSRQSFIPRNNLFRSRRKRHTFFAGDGVGRRTVFVIVQKFQIIVAVAGKCADGVPLFGRERDGYGQTGQRRRGTGNRAVIALNV